MRVLVDHKSYTGYEAVQMRECFLPLWLISYQFTFTWHRETPTP